MQVTKWKHLPFDAKKTPYFDRLCLQNSLRGNRPILVDCFVCLFVLRLNVTVNNFSVMSERDCFVAKNYIQIKKTQMLCYHY